MDSDIFTYFAQGGATPADIYMKEALKEAKKAQEIGEVPVGAVIVHDGRIIARAHNQVELLKDATAHAEMIALTQASAALSDWRLEGAIMVVTKEPCPMCAGAMVLSRVEHLIYGVADTKYGAAGSVFNIVDTGGLHHRVKTTGGVMESECRALLQDFFKKLRTTE